jgi:uncharacterized RmlC-like cupin family protein
LSHRAQYSFPSLQSVIVSTNRFDRAHHTWARREALKFVRIPQPQLTFSNPLLLGACRAIALRRRAQRWTFVTQMKEAKNEIQLNAVEDHDGILTIRGGGAQRNWNGIHYKQGMSAKNVGTKNLSANIATIPPSGVAYAHIHVDFEVILYIIEGKVRHEFGAGLKQVIENEAGDFIYIKPGVPHEVFNMSDIEPVVAFVARSSADEWDNIIPYDRNEPG